MERNFYTDDFEEFLKQKADQNKMYPSDRVWNNVYGSLHNRRRWFAIGLVLLLVSSGLMISREVLMTGDNQLAQKATPATHPLVTPARAEDASVDIGIAAYKGATLQSNHYSYSHTSGNNDEVAIATSPEAISGTAQPANTQALVPGNESIAVANLVTLPNEAAPQVIENDGPAKDDVVSDATEASLKNARVHPVAAFHSSISVDKKETNVQKEFNTVQVKIPLRDKWSVKLYSSPIVSYRRLSDLSKTAKYVPVAISYSGNIDSYVHHKPALGFELGTRIQYKLTPSLSVFSGVQLNYSRYYIDAYAYTPERALIGLTSSRSQPDTLSSYTSIRNFGGNAAEQLQNQYLQVAIPVGAELKLLGNDRIQLGIAASVQPSYMLASNTYLISSDFKNYVENNDLVRKFNLHSNFEAFISYETASGLRWQLGPQFRYQMLSSYSNQYPIREYLTEFGIKLGITRIIKKKK
ncbi:MAG TPA: hypothetical protein VGM41_03265 [Chitinophagaceae bacterium]